MHVVRITCRLVILEYRFHEMMEQGDKARKKQKGAGL
jgi:hypothetical protein